MGDSGEVGGECEIVDLESGALIGDDSESSGEVGEERVEVGEDDGDDEEDDGEEEDEDD